MARSQSARRNAGSELIGIMWVGSTSSSSQLDAPASSRFTSVGSRVTPCHSCPDLLLDAYAARSCHCLSRCSNRLLHCGFPSNVTSWIGCPSSCIHTFCIVQASASHQVMLPRSGMRTSLAEKTPRVHLRKQKPNIRLSNVVPTLPCCIPTRRPWKCVRGTRSFQHSSTSGGIAAWDFMLTGKRVSMRESLRKHGRLSGVRSSLARMPSPVFSIAVSFTVNLIRVEVYGDSAVPVWKSAFQSGAQSNRRCLPVSQRMQRGK